MLAPNLLNGLSSILYSFSLQPLNGHIKILGYIDLYITGGFATTHVVVSAVVSPSPTNLANTLKIHTGENIIDR